MPTPYITEFMATVPSCTQSTALGKVLDIFQESKCDRIVVVSEQGYPLGVLHLSRLLPYLKVGKGKSTKSATPSTAKKTDPKGKAISQATSGVANLLQPLSELGLSIIKPLATVPADFSLAQFWPYFQEQTYKTENTYDWALISGNGKFLGLLSIHRLLQFLTTDSSLDKAETTSINSPAVALPSDQNSAQEVGTLNSLIQLLDRLPLPLMLQTGNGQSVRRNLAWREHFDSLQDPDWLRKEIAELLESLPSDEQGKVPTEVSYFTEKASSWQKNDQERFAAPVSLPKMCHVGTNPDTCTCVCPMQNGTERVWQFVKIPLGNLLSIKNLSGEETNIIKEPLSQLDPNDNFHLANLMSYRDSPRSSALNQNQIDLWLVLAQDVTESHQVANELAAKNADLMQLNRLKDEFLACISHELKTPLTAILGLSSLLRDQILGELNERQARYTRLIHQSGRHLMTIVNDILDLTRMETGQLELMLAPVDIAAVCDRAYQQARQIHLGRKSADPDDINPTEPETRFILAIESGLDTLIADEMRLRQMLLNLLSNALKFTEVTGEVGLRVSYWEGWIAFTVWDTGIGIPEDKQHLIFQKFQQLENPLTRQFEGTGLGLVLTQRLARLHGGDVSFTSKPGSGSEFTLLLPPSPPNSTWGIETGEQGSQISFLGSRIEPTANFPTPYLSTRLVLIVESIPRLIEDLSPKLTSLGYRVIIARSGTEALEKARRLQPFAIFLNPLLPLLSGWDVLTLVKASPQTQHIPVIVTASMGEKEYALGKRADGFLSLPVAADSLQKSLVKLSISGQFSQKRSHSNTSLTILRLSATEKYSDSKSAENTVTDLSNLLYQHNYRVLEADDLVQAELLAKIWQPNIVLLEGKIAEPSNYLEQLIGYQALASLPLVTMDEATTQSALQARSNKGNLFLQVYPCLGANGALPEASILLQAIQVAAGISCKLTVLVVDICTLPDLGKTVATENSQPANANTCKKRTEWLQALIQYLQTAGLRVVTGKSWGEVLRQAQHYSVDLLLIDLGDSLPNSALVKALYDLRQVAQRPPTLVLTKQGGKTTIEATNAGIDDSSQYSGNQPSATGFANTAPSQINCWVSVLRDVATGILPGSISMEDLLAQIRQTLVQASASGGNTQSVNHFVASFEGGLGSRGAGEQRSRGAEGQRGWGDL